MNIYLTNLYHQNIVTIGINATDLLHPVMAQKVMNAHSPEEAKHATRNIYYVEMKEWANTKLKVMER